MSTDVLGAVLEPARLLAGRALFELLAPALRESRSSGALAVLGEVRPFYLRLKPGRSALLGLALEWQVDGGTAVTLASLYVGEDAAVAAAKARTLRLLEPAIGPALAELHEVPALFMAYPNDRVLKGLSAAADPRRLGNRLAGEHGAWAAEHWRVSARRTTIETIRFKPERRAVLRAHLSLRRDATGEAAEETVWVRVHRASERGARDAGWLAAARVSALAVPRVRWSDADRGLLVTSHVEGEPFARGGERAWAALGRSLAALWSAETPDGLPRHDDGTALESAVRTLHSLGRLAPELAARATELADTLARLTWSLRPAEAAFVHGDLGVDQVMATPDGVALLDWDEAAVGDPHADAASLAADLAERGEYAASRVPDLAAEALGSRWSHERFRWQLAVAHARRALGPLQRARSGWRQAAVAAIDRAFEALALAPAPAPILLVASSPAAAEPAPDALGLHALLDPGSRAALPGANGRALVLAAVWPAGERAHARLDAADAPGVPALWLDLGSRGAVAHLFPSDPALPALAEAIRRGFVAAGHRLGRRAALRSPDGASFLYLRPATSVVRAWARVREAHVMLDAARVPHAPPSPAAGGWSSRAAAGRAWPDAVPTADEWIEAGAQLARVHALGHGLGSSDRLEAAVSAGRSQAALVARVDAALAAALEHDLATARATAHAAGAATGTPAWVHGDLHPGQLVTGGETLWLDWERARIGEAEEDLGNLAAHLAWELGDVAGAAWAVFRRGYVKAGGAWSAPRFLAHARAAIARVRAIHSWRDAGRLRALDSTRWDRWREEVTSW